MLVREAGSPPLVLGNRPATQARTGVSAQLAPNLRTICACGSARAPVRAQRAHTILCSMHLRSALAVGTLPI